jgi:hypothetical protein
MKLKSFNEHLNEAYDPNDERYAKLRSLGLTDEPEADERIQGLQEEWGNDDEITRLNLALKRRTEDLIDKWFPTDDPADPTAEDHFQEYFDMLEELGPDELGMLEYLVIQKWNGY